MASTLVRWEAAGMALALPDPYAPRLVAFVEHGTVEPGWRVKLYGIAAAGRRPRPALLQAARDAARRELPAVCGGHGAAFVVAHDTPGLVYVTVAWWDLVNEIHQRLLSAPSERPRDLRAHDMPAVGCVWELAVHDFERRAWLRHVLKRPGAPDLDAYDADTFAEEF